MVLIPERQSLGRLACGDRVLRIHELACLPETWPVVRNRSPFNTSHIYCKLLLLNVEAVSKGLFRLLLSSLEHTSRNVYCKVGIWYVPVNIPNRKKAILIPGDQIEGSSERIFPTLLMASNLS